jgi:hypothetical protein
MGKKDAQRLMRMQMLAEQNPEDEILVASNTIAKKQQKPLPQQKAVAPTLSTSSANQSSAPRRSEATERLGEKRPRGEEKPHPTHKQHEKKKAREVPAASDDEVDDDEDDEEEAAPDRADLTLNFDLGSMQESDKKVVGDFLDRFLFDNYVHPESGEFIYCDREDFATALLENPFTSVIQVDQESDDEDEKNEEGEEEEEEEGEDEELPDFFGVISVVDVLRQGETHESLKSFKRLLDQKPVAVLSRGHNVKDLFQSNGPVSADTPSKALLLINDHMPTIPSDVAIQQVQFTLNSVTEHLLDALEGKKSARKNKRFLYADPSTAYLVVLAKVQRKKKGELTDSDEKGNRKAKKQRTESNAVSQGASNGNSTSGAGSATPAVDLNEFGFLREEDELLYKKRDTKFSVQLFKFQPEHEKQLERDIPHCVVFALPFMSALSAFEMGEE